MPMHGGHIDIEGDTAKLKSMWSMCDGNQVRNTDEECVYDWNYDEKGSAGFRAMVDHDGIYDDDHADEGRKSASEIEAFRRSPPWFVDLTI